MFLHCPSLKVVAGTPPYYVSEQMFYGTNALERLTVKHEDVGWITNSIVGGAFVACDSLKELVYDSTKAIADNNMNSKWAMLMTSETPPTINAASPQWGKYPIYVPDSAVEAYKTASGWSNAAAYILPASQYPDK